MKRCNKCKTEKPLEDFYKDRSSKDGHQGMCKVCKKEYHRKYHLKYYQKHKDGIKEYQQGYYQKNRTKVIERTKKYQQNHMEKHTEAVRKYRQNNPEKYKARSMVNWAVQSGKLERPVFCEKCGLPAKTEGHHEDYSKPLEVDWLCRSCHIEVHKELVLV
ncbi:MAG: hypothetical protein JRI56_00205 [Deltaproteobacteria bacterium]|nr:hypothetical protein [Deltaproteobacteria bacterium]